jgi:uncharacterized protein (TIGR00297 family)
MALGVRAAVGLFAAGIVALAGRRARALSASGAIAATLAGTATVIAGWSWGALLVAHFGAASSLSKNGGSRKARLLTPILDKNDERDAWQVLANGGLFVVAGLLHVAFPSPAWYAIGIGALAASSADTWATEVGTLDAGDPVSIVSGRRVAAGTSGGVTVSGSLAALAGALFIAACAALARWPVSFMAVALGGIAGALSDSLIGATLQARRWCDGCGLATERRVHTCGVPTRYNGGHRLIDNDVVNAVCSAVGAMITLLLR